MHALASPAIDLPSKQLLDDNSQRRGWMFRLSIDTAVSGNDIIPLAPPLLLSAARTGARTVGAIPPAQLCKTSVHRRHSQGLGPASPSTAAPETHQRNSPRSGYGPTRIYPAHAHATKKSPSSFFPPKPPPPRALRSDPAAHPIR